MDINSNKNILQASTHHSNVVRDLSFSNDSSLLASVSDDRHVNIYDVYVILLVLVMQAS